MSVEVGVYWASASGIERSLRIWQGSAPMLAIGIPYEDPVRDTNVYPDGGAVEIQWGRRYW